jgi:hypothetical protein
MQFVPDSGHLEQIALHSMMVMAWNYGSVKELAELHGFTHPNSLEMLKSSKSNKKAWNFLMIVCRTAKIRGFIREWRHSVKVTAEALGTVPDYADWQAFLTWVDTSCRGDKSFENEYVFWAKTVIPCVSVIRKSQRQNDIVGYMAAVKTLLPLLLMRGHVIYVRVLLYEMVDWLKVFNANCLQLRMENFTTGGKGFGYVISAFFTYNIPYSDDPMLSFALLPCTH